MAPALSGVRNCRAAGPIVAAAHPSITLRKERHIYHWISASLGVATVMAGDETLEELFRRADVALYQAKETGRNKVMSSVVDHGTAPQQQSAVG